MEKWDTSANRCASAPITSPPSMSTERFIKARTRSSNVGTVVGITLVLLMLGVLGFLLLNARAMEQYFKEEVQVDVYLKRDLKEVDVMKFRKRLDTEAFT